MITSIRRHNNTILCAGLRKERVIDPTTTARTCTRQTIICQWTGILADVSLLNPKYICNCFDLSLDVFAYQPLGNSYLQGFLYIE